MPGRRAFSLVELLVVIAVLAILVSLLLPVLPRARESARRAQCMNHQRQLALAAINYESTYGSFPPALPSCTNEAYNALGVETGNWCAGPNWAMQVLPQLDEHALYKQLLKCVREGWQVCDDCESQPGHLGRQVPGMMLCPSAARARQPFTSQRAGLQNLAKGNYAACLGSEHYRTAIERNRQIQHEEDDGLQLGVMTIVMISNYKNLIELQQRGKINGEWKLGQGQGTTSPRIKDGLSKTILLSEVLPWDGLSRQETASQDIRGVWTSAAMGASTYSHKYGPNARMDDMINACSEAIPADNPLRCNQTSVSGPAAAETWASARSQHLGGVVAARADASVGFFSDEIHLPLWQALATRAGAEF